MRKLFNIPFNLIFILSTLEILISGIVIYLIPGDPKNDFLWGFSVFRLINLAGLALLAIIIFVFLLQKKAIKKFEIISEGYLSTYQKWSKICWVIAVISGIFFLLLLIPSYQLKDYQLVWERLYPNFILGEMLALNIAFYLFSIGSNKSYFPKLSRESALRFIQSVIPFALCVLALVLFVGITKVGIVEDPMHWNTAGVPILASQVILIFFGYLLLIGLRSFGSRKPISLNITLVFFLLWIGTAILWQSQPIARNYFVYLPKDTSTIQYYPKSDAQRFDQGAELMLMGEGIYGGITEEKPFLMAALALVKGIGAGGYENDIKVQVVILSLIIPGLFLIGKELCSREFGLILGLMGALYEINTFNSSGYINNVHVKLIMSEPYSLLGMVWISYFFIRWRKNTDHLHLGLVTFSLIGFFSFVRPNFLGVFLAVFAISLFTPGRIWIINLKWTLIASLSMLGITLPWAVYAYQKYGYTVVFNKINFILQDRYRDVLTFVGSSGKNAKAALFTGDSLLVDFQRFGDYGYAAISHFFNNLIKSVLIFPTGLKFDSISIVLDQPYWNETIVWDGKVGLLFFINLLIIIIGVTVLYKKHRGIALIPLILSIGYYLTLALARTSGGRYLSPGIWAFYLYYFAGLFSIFICIVSRFGWKSEVFLKERPKPNNIKSKMLLPVSLIIITIGFSIPLADHLIPRKYEEKSRVEIIEILHESTEFSVNYQMNDKFANFVDSGKGEVFYGDLHYPVRVAVPESDDAFQYKFSILGPSISRYSTLMTSATFGPFADGAEVGGFGCKTDLGDQLVYLYFIEEQITIESDKSYQEICIED